MARYELYVRATKQGQKDFILDVDTVTPETLRDMWDFFENEYQYYELYPSIYETILKKRTPQPRGKNTLIDCFFKNTHILPVVLRQQADHQQTV